MTEYTLRRIYEKPTDQDGARVLVDRLWPRGVSKEKADLDQWAKELAPSPDLRKWFDHDPEKFEEFSAKYREELDTDPEHQAAFAELPEAKRITFLYAAKDERINHAVVLAQWCQEQGSGSR